MMFDSPGIGTLFTLLVIPSVHVLIAKDHTKTRARAASEELEPESALVPSAPPPSCCSRALENEPVASPPVAAGPEARFGANYGDAMGAGGAIAKLMK